MHSQRRESAVLESGRHLPPSYRCRRGAQHVDEPQGRAAGGVARRGLRGFRSLRSRFLGARALPDRKEGRMKPIRAAVALPKRSAAAPLAVRARTHSRTISELCRALAAGGRWWLVPMIVVLGASALLLAVVAAVEYVAPFVYTI